MEMSIAPPKEESIQIREVWNDNLEEEFALIREIVDRFNHVAMDTEFPGVVLRPVGNFKNIRFFDLINTYFPMVYDIKHLMKFCNSLHGGLNKLAELLEVERIGVCHQAGSDSLLTSCTFKKLKDNFFSGSTEKYAGVLYGLGVENGQNIN
ncbi:hypothetical protein SADUNF_Sadunf18G0015300 [Salix dunnii]|uniref:Uncharacterized protein n=1 Tax=Salix dunnii TaxID=1413687 RepID=A0A835J2U4_9ROSI|nr:hypothetical protein SADUNF_Sadunf18G0015300 [Salix dunnii]